MVTLDKTTKHAETCMLAGGPSFFALLQYELHDLKFTATVRIALVCWVLV
jgi:hypothetical protein